MFLAILVCKIGRFVGKLVGKGSSLPGKYALKICPDILRRVKMPPHILAVTGSNGKTSTVEMIAAILRADGRRVVYNEEGSNQIEGVTTLVLTHATLTGRVKADVLLIESPATAIPNGSMTPLFRPFIRTRSSCSMRTIPWSPASAAITKR